MTISELEQPPFNTTLMGCIKGAVDFYDIDLSVPMLFGLTGHAFLINIHRDLCPSGPYCWNRVGFIKLLKKLGIAVDDSRQFGKGVTRKKREATNGELKNALDEGKLVMLEFLEFQLFAGYDETGFNFHTPWQGRADSERERLTFSTWEECLDSMDFVGFSILSENGTKPDISEQAIDALDYGLDLNRNPRKYRCDRYKIGFEAYETWIDYLEDNPGDTHGNWWNAMVWAECRKMGSKFFEELFQCQEDEEAKDLCRDLSHLYQKMYENFSHLKEKEQENDRKTKLLHSNLNLEFIAAERMNDLLTLLKKQ